MDGFVEWLNRMMPVLVGFALTIILGLLAAAFFLGRWLLSR